MAAWDAHAGQGGSAKGDSKHDITVLKGNDERLLGYVAVQHNLGFGMQEIPNVTATV